MHYHTVIFDLDGTLLNTLEDLWSSCCYALTACGMPPRTLDEVRRFVGNGIERLMELAVPDGRDNPAFQQAVDTMQVYYKAHNRIKTAPYDGISALIETLHAAGFRLAVVSNKPDSSVRQLVEEIFPTIPVAIGERTGVRRKPAPDTVLEAMRLLGSPPADCVYVGDSEVDIATAVNAGIDCISVTWGFRPKKLLSDAGAVCFADTPEAVLALLSHS